MDSKFLSAYDRLMESLNAEGKIQAFDDAQAFAIKEDIKKEMEQFNIEKQAKAAQSERALGELVLTV